MKAWHALALLLASPAACGQWTSDETEEGITEAIVRNDEGATIRIWLDAEQRLRASFRLGSGLIALDSAGCPTMQIDERTPENLALEVHECTVSGDTARVVLSRAQDGRLDSPTLLELMNGSQLTVRYRMAHAGYASARFTLRRSKQALNEALGERVAIVDD